MIAIYPFSQVPPAQVFARPEEDRRDVSGADREAALDFYAFGIVGLLLKYSGRRDADPEQLAEQMYRLLAGGSGQAEEGGGSPAGAAPFA